jgi:hypothetical protein
MQLAALVHNCRSPFAYPVDENHLRVVLKAARGDLAAATVVYGDRYAWPPDSDLRRPMERLGDDGTHEYWGATLPSPSHRVRYLIYVEGVDGTYTWLTEQGAVSRRPAKNFFQFPYIHRADLFQQPAWISGAVFYQIFPDRFYNGNPKNDPPAKNKMKWGALPTREKQAGGDLAGIEQKLDYVQDLGIGCVYTTPIFKSPTNHKYDTTDYYKIDPAFGTNEEFKSLVKAAHARGIRFLLDAVFNHSGKEWFAFKDVIKNGADSKYVDWFYNIHSFPVDPERINYETFAINVASMPKLNTGNPGLKQYLLKVAEYWIKEADIDGWRLDVANEVNHGFWRDFRDTVKAAKADAWILGEIWHEATEWLQGDQYDSVMNYPWREATLSFLKGDIDALEYDRTLTRLRFTHSHEIMKGLLALLGTHDTARVRTELGGTLEKAAQAAVLLLTAEGVTMAPLVPPMLNALAHAAEAGQFPRDHHLRWVKCGAAPLAPELAHRFTALTGVPVRQGYGMTEASPVTHIGVLEPYRPDSIGFPVAATECRILDEHGDEVAPGEPGELVMRGPQFMLGYWRAPEATAAVLRDGWYWSGDLVRRDPDGFFYVLDRRKEMIKFKGFPVAPAEVESVLLEHPAVRDCGVVPRPDSACGEIPCAFVVLRPGFVPSAQLESELAAWVAGELTSYKQPREIHFVDQIPHTPSGKILRRELRRLLVPAADLSGAPS